MGVQEPRAYPIKTRRLFIMGSFPERVARVLSGLTPGGAGHALRARLWVWQTSHV